MKKLQKGEVATIITIITLVALGVGTLASALIVSNRKKPQSVSTKAASDPGYCRDNPEGNYGPGYVWKADCDGQLGFVKDTSYKPGCHSNDDCKQNTGDPSNVWPGTSNWCYGFKGNSGTWDDWRCLQLQHCGDNCGGGGGGNPTSPPQPTGGSGGPTSPPQPTGGSGSPTSSVPSPTTITPTINAPRCSVDGYCLGEESRCDYILGSNWISDGYGTSSGCQFDEHCCVECVANNCRNLDPHLADKTYYYKKNNTTIYYSDNKCRIRTTSGYCENSPTQISNPTPTLILTPTLIFTPSPSPTPVGFRVIYDALQPFNLTINYSIGFTKEELKNMVINNINNITLPHNHCIQEAPSTGNQYAITLENCLLEILGCSGYTIGVEEVSMYTAIMAYNSASGNDLSVQGDYTDVSDQSGSVIFQSIKGYNSQDILYDKNTLSVTLNFKSEGCATPKSRIIRFSSFLGSQINKNETDNSKKIWLYGINTLNISVGALSENFRY